MSAVHCIDEVGRREQTRHSLIFRRLWQAHRCQVRLVDENLLIAGSINLLLAIGGRYSLVENFHHPRESIVLPSTLSPSTQPPAGRILIFVQCIRDVLEANGIEFETNKRNCLPCSDYVSNLTWTSQVDKPPLHRSTCTTDEIRGLNPRPFGLSTSTQFIDKGHLCSTVPTNEIPNPRLRSGPPRKVPGCLADPCRIPRPAKSPRVASPGKPNRGIEDRQSLTDINNPEL